MGPPFPDIEPTGSGRTLPDPTAGGEDFILIHPEECIDCGARVPECPVNAIFEESDVPEQWKDYIAKNADPFKGDASLPKSPTREKWEAEKAQ